MLFKRQKTKVEEQTVAELTAKERSYCDYHRSWLNSASHSLFDPSGSELRARELVEQVVEGAFHWPLHIWNRTSSQVDSKSNEKIHGVEATNENGLHICVQLRSGSSGSQRWSHYKLFVDSKEIGECYHYSTRHYSEGDRTGTLEEREHGYSGIEYLYKYITQFIAQQEAPAKEAQAKVNREKAVAEEASRQQEEQKIADDIKKRL
jgi:hypothetical protein